MPVTAPEDLALGQDVKVKTVILIIQTPYRPGLMCVFVA